MSVEKRCIAQKQARPFGLRAKFRHAVLEDLAREQPLPAPSAWPGEILRGNAVRDETATDPTNRAFIAASPIRCIAGLRNSHAKKNRQTALKPRATRTDTVQTPSTAAYIRAIAAQLNFVRQTLVMAL
ncbi:hypothetical protein [Pseudomonas anguilliseptica]|uniref:hypothetical protein n=1 Tax=Pseudomonas anguilliseptica TaxID=53406 RepID=UPI001F449F88|nr:hypothetical protein [Pseudomonas anguilliseptica]MCE5362378.1 hypothetical protein [Pseudomonas anguilliseptica]